jgi:hypothetical protein
MARRATRNRVKVSATLAPELITRVREYQREAGLPTFSAALEEVLWRQLMAEQEKAYYLSMTAEERAEQEAWATFATEQFFKVNREG